MLLGAARSPKKTPASLLRGADVAGVSKRSRWHRPSRLPERVRVLHKGVL